MTPSLVFALNSLTKFGVSVESALLECAELIAIVYCLLYLFVTRVLARLLATATMIVPTSSPKLCVLQLAGVPFVSCLAVYEMKIAILPLPNIATSISPHLRPLPQLLRVLAPRAPATTIVPTSHLLPSARATPVKQDYVKHLPAITILNAQIRLSPNVLTPTRKLPVLLRAALNAQSTTTVNTFIARSFVLLARVVWFPTASTMMIVHPLLALPRPPFALGRT